MLVEKGQRLKNRSIVRELIGKLIKVLQDITLLTQYLIYTYTTLSIALVYPFEASSINVSQKV